MADYFKANTGTTVTVVVGGSATGEIEAARHVDWFAVELEADRRRHVAQLGSVGYPRCERQIHHRYGGR